MQKNNTSELAVEEFDYKKYENLLQATYNQLKVAAEQLPSDKTIPILMKINRLNYKLLKIHKLDYENITKLSNQ